VPVEPPIVKQLRTLAKIGVRRPSAVANKLRELDELCRAISATSRKGEDAGEVARRLCDTVLECIKRLKREWPAETEIEKAERDNARRALDATFGLGEFERYERITHRREVFIGAEPGSAAYVRDFTRGIERKVLSRLADQLLSRKQPAKSPLRAKPPLRFVHELSSSPVKRHFDLEHWATLTGLQVLKRLDGFLGLTHTDVELHNVDHQDFDSVLLRLADLYLMDLRPAWAASEVFLGRLVEALEPVDQAAKETLEDYPWFRFTLRERELLDAAVEASDNRNSFLEYLESRRLGQTIIEEWQRWVVCQCHPDQRSDSCSIQRIRLAHQTALTLCETGRYQEVVDWLDKTCDPAHPGMPPIFPIYINEQST
jgi:hypothetical protein